MSAALDALLAELTPPPVPAGLAERVTAAARAVAQERHQGRARRAASWRDRRGRWRRGLLIGAGAMGLAVSGAVAATLAGIPLPAKVEAVMAKLPLVGKEAPEPIVPRPLHRRVERVAAPAARISERMTQLPVADPVRMHEARQLRRLAVARQIVAERRAAGLPTPRADRIERRMERRMERWRQATPEQKARMLELRRQRQEARRARLEARLLPAPPPPPLAARDEAITPRPMGQGAVYGPVDPRVTRAPLEGDRGQRLRQFRAERLERLRARGLERQRLEGMRPMPTRRAPPPVRRERPRPPTR